LAIQEKHATIGKRIGHDDSRSDRAELKPVSAGGIK
jgi:hypothetical protein